MKQKIIIKSIPRFKTADDVKELLDELIEKGYYIQSSMIVLGDLVCVVNETVNIKSALSTLTNKRSRR